MRAQAPEPDALLLQARQYLESGLFFLALDLAGQVEQWIRENDGEIYAEGLARELAPLMSEAQRQTAEAIEGILPGRKEAW